MILLHLILSNYPGLPDDELLEDVEKSLEIFQSMDDIVVARRCAEMLREVLEVARTCLARRGRGETCDLVNMGRGARLDASGSGFAGKASSGLMTGCRLAGTASLASGSSASAVAPSTTGTSLPGMDVDVPSGYGPSGTPTPALLIENMTASDGLECEDFFFSLFSQNPQQPPDRTRTEILANLVDPSILEDFAFGGQETSFF